MRRFELSEGSSNKFWQIELAGTDFTVHWGRIGTAGQSQTKSFPTTAKAQAEHDKLVAEKTKKGYAEVATTGAPMPAPKPAAPKPAAAPAPPAAAPAAAVAPAPAPAPLPPPAPAKKIVGGIAWSTGALRAIAPRHGSKLVEPRVGERDKLWAKILKGATPGMRLGLKYGLKIANALTAPMTSLINALDSESAPASVDAETAAAMFVLLGPKTGWQDEDRHGDIASFLCVTQGPLFAFEALQLASTMAEQVESTDGNRVAVVKREQATQAPANWWRRRDDLGWRELRAVVVAAPDELRAQLVSKVESWRPTLAIETRILFTAALERAEWASADLADALKRGDQHHAAAPLLLLSETPDAFMSQLGTLFANSWERVRAVNELRYDLIARYESAAAPVLIDLLKQQVSKELAEALALILSTEVAECFAKHVTVKDLRAIASEYLLANAEVSLQPIASQATGNGAAADAAQVILKGLVAKHPAVVAAQEGDLGPAARALIAELRADAEVKDEASPAELPDVLRELPWTRKTKLPPPVVVNVASVAAPAKLLWTEAEQKTLAAAASGWLAPQPDKRQANLDEIATVNGGKSIEGRGIVFAQLPPEDAVQQFNAAALEKFNFNWWPVTPLLLARHGRAVLPGLLQLAAHDASTALDALFHVDAPEVAPFVAEAYVRLKKRRNEAAAWLARLPETAAKGLLAQALGPAGKKRGEAEEALRACAAAGHRKQLEQVAASQGSEASKGLDSVLDYDPLLALPKKLPALPQWVTPAAFTRPLLTGRKKALSVESTEALCTMLAMSAVDAPYAGVTQVKAACDPRSLADFAWDLFQAWIFAGAPSKESWALNALGHLGNDETARKLTPLLRAWPGEAAHARAVIGLDVLARIGTDVALMHLHGIAQKLKFKGLQEKAKEKIAQVAEARGFASEELADRLVPDLGLDDDGTLWLDFGPRKFKVVFDELLKPGVTGEDLKRLSDLPKPRKDDDAEKSEGAVETWKALKKDAKTISQAQLLRLELAMCSQRRWEPAVFRQFLVEHPLLVHLVRRLVWGVYDAKNALLGSFRVAEDGSYASEKDETFELKDGAGVGIAHRLDLSEAQAGAWGQVFADYEVLQPFEQLARGIHPLGAKEAAVKELETVKGLEVPTGKVLGLDARGWRRGPPQDGGVVCWYEKRVEAGVLSLDLDPGIYTGMIAESPKQKLGALSLGPDGGAWGGAKMELGKLTPVAYSEVVRDLESLKES